MRTDLKHMKGMLSNKRFLEKGSNIILRWAIWLDGYDFEIVYKAGTENYLADMLTREGSAEIKEIKMFRPLCQGGISSSTSIPQPPRTFRHFTVCSNCTLVYCVDCLIMKIQQLPFDIQHSIL